MNQRIANAIADEKTVFFLFPSEKIKQLIIANDHPHILSMPASVKSSLLEGKVYPISNQMVLDFLKGNLDEKNHFLLSQCEIRVMTPQQELLNDLKVAEKNNP